MTQQIDLNTISIKYDGEIISTAPNTYKSFLELLRDKEGLTNTEFMNKTVWRGDFPITSKQDYIKAIRYCKDEGIMQIDLVSNELDKKEGIKKKDYLQFLELKEPEEIIKINIEEEDNKEETIYINSNVNELYAITQVTQYYKNNNDRPVELSIIYPLKKEIIFRKFTINVNGKKSYSKIFEKEKAEEKYSDAMASGNIGIFAKYKEKESNSYSINIGNVAPNVMIELTSEFIQFITSDDMSLCYSVMTSYPTFSDGNSRNYLKNINGKILIKAHSRITRLINQNFTIDEYFKREFDEDCLSCNIEFKILNDSTIYNSTLNLLFRTEKMNEPYLLSQYNPEKDETSYIFGMIYNQKPIPIPEKPDTDINTNYYLKYQNNEKSDTPSLFIFLIDQSGSMSGSSIKIVCESLLLFLQSLPKDSYFQLIGFGSTYYKINDKPVLYNKENVKYTMDKIKKLKANLGGTNIYSPLKEIFNSKDYDNINLGRNLFILTDGEVENREKCLELISTNCEKFKIHAIGIGSSFDKKLIQNAGLQGKGTYYFVNNINDVNIVIIQSLSKCLREYLLDVKLSLDNIKPEYEFLPKNNFIYPDEILNYYFILKGKNNNQNIQINFESLKKKDNFIFTNEKIVKENDGEIIGQIIIGNILKNNDNKLNEETEIKLSKNYQILSNKTSLFAVAEGEESNKIYEFKQVTTKEKFKENNYYNNYNNIYNNSNYNYNQVNNYYNGGYRGRGRGFRGGFRGRRGTGGRVGMGGRGRIREREFGEYGNNRGVYKNNNFYGNTENYYMNKTYNQNDNRNDNFYRANYNMYNCEFQDRNRYKKKYKNSNKFEDDSNDNEEKNKMNINDNEFEFDNYDYSNKKKNKTGIKKEKKEKKEYKEYIKEEKVEFNPKELVLTQDIFDGYWKLNAQTNLLIEKKKEIYEKIEKIVKDKYSDKIEIKVTLLVLYYLNNDSSINKLEYSLIIKKGINFLEKNGINYEEIFSSLK